MRLAVGGVDATTASDYLAAGAVAVGVGGALLRDAPDGGHQSALADSALELVEALGP